LDTRQSDVARERCARLSREIRRERERSRRAKKARSQDDCGKDAHARRKARMRALFALEPCALWRDAFSPGHFTGSALVTNARGDKVLLMRHKYIGRWMQFGSHADGDPDLSKVALREASEESGFRQHKCSVLGGLFDIDIHPIPANPKKNEPAHEHFDLRYLLELDDALPLPLNPEGCKRPPATAALPA
jgi:hypothetical protein